MKVTPGRLLSGLEGQRWVGLATDPPDPVVTIENGFKAPALTAELSAHDRQTS